MSEEKILSASLLPADPSGQASTEALPNGEPITEVELDPEIWYRGDCRHSYLLQPVSRRSQCCLGIACSQLGIPDDALRGKGCLRDVRCLPSLIEQLQNTGNVAGKLYGINDSSDIKTDEERVSKLNAVLTDAHIPLRFTLKVGSGNQGTQEHAAPTRRSEAP